MKNVILSTGHFFDNAFAPSRTSKQRRTAPIKKKRVFPLCPFLLFRSFLYHKRNPLGAVAVCRGPSKGWPGEVGGERAGHGGMEGGCARGRAPKGGTREGIEAIDVFT